MGAVGKTINNKSGILPNTVFDKYYINGDRQISDFQKLYGNSKIEYSMIINTNGKITSASKGTESQVSGLLEHENEINVHNHPSGSTFSLEDLNGALYFGDGRIVATSKGIYYFLINNKSDKQGFSSELQKELDKPLSKSDIKRIAVTTDADKKQWGKMNAKRDSARNAWITKMAKKYGIDYGFIPKSSFK